MDLQLVNKKAFVSGSTQGIGLAIARALLAEGAAVVVNGRSDDRVRDAVDRLKAECPLADVSGIAADFGVVGEMARLVAALDDIDILVNNVGCFEVAAFEEIADATWQRYFDVNVMSGVRLSRRVLAGMLARGWGRIVFVSSESGVNVPADMIHYGVTKAAMLALGNGLAKRTRGTDVTVNSILGGPTFSDGVAAALGDVAERQNMSLEELSDVVGAGHQTSLLQRFITPDEIARLAVYLASPVSSATNGAALRADGGVLTGIL